MHDDRRAPKDDHIDDWAARIERQWDFERAIARARSQAGLSLERSLDWLVMLSLARDWTKGLSPDVATTTSALDLPRTTVRRSIDGLVARKAISLHRDDRDTRRQIIEPDAGFHAIFNPLFQRISDLLADQQETVPDVASRLSESITDAVLITDAPAPGQVPIILSANSAFSRLTGYSSEEAVGKAPTMLQGEGTDPAIRRTIRNAIDRRCGTSGALVNYRKDGTSYLCHLTVTPISDEAGIVRYFMGIARDIGTG